MTEAIDTPEIDPNWGEKAIANFFNNWIIPEVEKRKAAGTLGDDFFLLAAQIIFTIEPGHPQVRLNSEVRATAKVKPVQDLVPGNPVFQHDIKEFESIELTDSDSNSAHITILRWNDKWVCHFDFHYNAGRVGQMIEAAKQFVESAEDSLKKKLLHPFVESLWSATELLAKAFLLWTPSQQLLKSNTHKYIHAQFNLAG